MISIPIDRFTKGVINWGLFLPISLYSLYNSVYAFSKGLIGRENFRVSYMLMALPVLLWYLVFFIRLGFF